jgi:hypothetical protein
MARERSTSPIGRAPSETLAVRRRLASWPPAVQTVTPPTLTLASASARSTALAMALAASSTSTTAPPRMPRDWT